MEPPASASEISGSCSNGGNKVGDDPGLRRGQWTVDEDLLLVNYIESHGEGRWNSLARSAGLKRTGKSCRLRWMNYLRPDVRRGNITPEEQLLILDLHSRWGNRWSRIAQQLPGRTDNEIKNYWRTKVQKRARQLNCDVDSKQFRDVVRYIWVPRLIERIHATKIDRQTIHRQNDQDIINNDTSPQAIEPVERSVAYEPQNTTEMDHQTMAYNIWSVDDFWSLQQILQ